MKKKVYAFFLIIVVFTLVCFVMFNFVLYPKKYKNIVIANAQRFGIDSALVYAIIKAESDFDKNAKSSSGALGLMQIIPSTAKWIASELDEEFISENLYDPEKNVLYGCFYLDYLFDKFNDVKVVVCAYNAGESKVRDWINEEGEFDESLIDYNETKVYLKRVMGFWNVYKNDEISK